MPDIFDEIEIEEKPRDVFDEIEYTPSEPKGFGDLKQAESDIARESRRGDLLAEQTALRQQGLNAQTDLNSWETAEALTQTFSTPISSAIHGVRQLTGLEDPNNPLPIVPPIPRLDGEKVKQALPYAMPGIPEAITGTQQAAAGFGDFLLQPDTVALGGLGSASKLVQSLAGSVFSGDMAKHTPEQASILGETSVTGKPEDVVRESLNTGLMLVGAAAPIAHASLPKSAALVEEKFKVEKPGESKWPKVPDELKEAEKPKDIFDELQLEEIKEGEAIPARDDLGPSGKADSNPVDAGKSEVSATFIGEQPGYKDLAPIRFYNVDKPIIDATGKEIAVAGSTVSERTLRENGIKIPEEQPELIGMGGAVQSEFTNSPQTATSIKNAQVDVERVKRGLPPAIEPAKRSFGTVWDDAMAIVDRDPTRQEVLISELREKPRSLTDTEDALLLHRQIDLQNEYGKATRDLAQAFDDGRMDAVELEKNRVQRISDQLYDLYEINKKVGTETGRGLNARKMAAFEDFTLANLELQKRAAKGGKPLTPEERVEVQKIADEYKAKSEALEKLNAEKDARILELESTRKLGEIEKEVKASPYVIEIAEKYVAKLEKRAKQAEKELQEIFARTSTGVDPTILLKVTEIAAYHIGRKSLDFAKWSNEVLSKYGEKIKPYLEEAWKNAQTKIRAELDKELGKKSEPVKKLVLKQDSSTLIEDIGKQVSEGAKIDLAKTVNELARKFVIEGNHGLPILDKIHETLVAFMPELTKREVKEAFSGYGKYKLLSKDEISVELRDLRGQQQQLLKIEDMEAGKPPQKTGNEQRTKSDKERALTKIVEYLKRKGGYIVTDPAKQLKTALDAIKTRLKNEITDLQSQINSGEKIVKEKRGVKYDAEANQLKTRRDELKKQFDDIFGKRELTDEQRIRGAVSAVERSIADLENRIKTGDIAPKKVVSKTPQTPELQAAKAKRDALREELEELRELAKPKKTPEELALKSYKTRMARRIEQLEEKLAKGDFTKKEPRKVVPDTEAVSLKYELERVKRRWNEGLLKDKLKNRTTGQRVRDSISEALLFQKALKTAIDFSAVLRQGGAIAFSSPILSSKAIPEMFRAMKSEKALFEAEEAIYSRPNAPLYQEGKLFLSRHGEGLNKMEEAYLGRLADKVPLISHSSRAYSAYLNKIRADKFDALIATLTKDGKPTNAEVKAIGNAVNVFTGRGSVGPRSDFGIAGLNLFFAPRYVVSRFQMLGGQPLYQGTARTRKLLGKEYIKIATGILILYEMAKLAGGEVDLDLSSSDFGKIEIGGNVIDPLFGLSQVVSFVGKSGKNIFNRLMGRKHEDNAKVLGRFIKSKLSPSAQSANEFYTGKTFLGDEADWQSFMNTLVVPINPEDVLEIYKQNGIPEATALSILNTLGWPVSPRKEN